jgi:hypothetical protein
MKQAPQARLFICFPYIGQKNFVSLPLFKYENNCSTFWLFLLQFPYLQNHLTLLVFSSMFWLAQMHGAQVDYKNVYVPLLAYCTTIK